MAKIPEEFERQFAMSAQVINVLFSRLLDEDLECLGKIVDSFQVKAIQIDLSIEEDAKGRHLKVRVHTQDGTTIMRLRKLAN